MAKGKSDRSFKVHHRARMVTRSRSKSADVYVRKIVEFGSTKEECRSHGYITASISAWYEVEDENRQ
jgi:hypothetical protein